MYEESLENVSDGSHQAEDVGSSEEESDSGSTTPLTAAQTPRTPRPSDLKVHHCPYDGCRKSFNRLSRLMEHERSHTGKRIFKCKQKGCTKDFLRESHLKHHVKSAHTDLRDYACNWEGCDKKFATGTRLRRHQAVHEGRERYRCRGYEGCNDTFRKHDTLTRHILTAHEGQKGYQCLEQDHQTGESCTMAFYTAEKLRAHQRAQHDRSRFACNICLDVVFALQYEETTSSDVPTSNACFPTYALLQSHISEAHPPTCPHCPTVCTTQRELRRHVEVVHGNLKVNDQTTGFSNVSCNYPGCTRIFTRKGNLNVHINTVHRGERAFVCGKTDIALSKSITLPVDEAGREGVIEDCGRSFTSKSSLEEHIRTAHLGLESRRMERKRKRKAAELASVAETMPDDGDEEEWKPKPKKRNISRKKTKTVLGSLTGVKDDLSTLQGQKTSLDEDSQGQSESGDQSPMFALDMNTTVNNGYYLPAEYHQYTDFQRALSWNNPPCDSYGHVQSNGLGPAIDPLLLLS